MSEIKFKAGDKVYYPRMSFKIMTLKHNNSPTHPLAIDHIDFTEPYTENGTLSIFAKVTDLFHATEENHALLEKLYGLEFEKPPKRKNPKEIIKAMKNAGHKYVLCKAQNLATDEWETVIAMGFSTYDSPDSSKEYMYDYFRTSYYDYFPINSKGEKIIDFVDGEPILEN